MQFGLMALIHRCTQEKLIIEIAFRQLLDADVFNV